MHLVRGLPDGVCVVPFVRFVGIHVFMRGGSVGASVGGGFVELALLTDLFYGTPNLRLRTRTPRPRQVCLSKANVSGAIA